jgi:NAD+ synthase
MKLFGGRKMLEEKIKLAKMDPKRVTKEIEDFIIEEVADAKKTGAVLGLSGGIDSTTVAYLAKGAFDRYYESTGKTLTLFGLMMPSASSRQEDMQDAIYVADTLGIDYKIIQIQPMIDACKKGNDTFKDKYHTGNLASRLRMMNLYGEALKRDSLVLGTGNRDEDFGLGYFTKYGDGGVDLSPIGMLSKRLVRELATYKGVPQRLVNRVPTAGLWPGQTDEGELGFTYDQAEYVLEGLMQNLSKEEIKKATGFKTETIDNILGRHFNNLHKMTMPPIAKVSLFYGGKQ